MPRRISQDTLPDFYKMGTLADMKNMAGRLGRAGKAITRIKEVENYLEDNADKITEQELKLGMKETREYARIVSGAIREAMGFLNTAHGKIESYKRSVR